MSAGLIQRLIESGTPADLVAEVAMELGKAEAERAILAERRRNERERKARSRDVTGQDVTGRDIRDTPPILDKESAPQTPLKEINPTPRARDADALARKAGGFGPPDGVGLHVWNAFCAQRKKAVTAIAYDRIVTTLRESTDAGWPPGEPFERAIESGWETIYVPKGPRNGQQASNTGLGRTAAAAISVFGPPARQASGPEVSELRRVGVGAG